MSTTDTTTQHTPGPWKVYDGMDANAHLIAAAPELLEALVRAEEAMSFALSCIPMSHAAFAGLSSDLAKARAAIAKAEGRA